MTRSRRSLSTLVLRDDIKEKILADLKEFLDSEEWYTLAGVPHRRGMLLLVSPQDVLLTFARVGYLLYGKPGTGKSSTIHAMVILRSSLIPHDCELIYPLGRRTRSGGIY